MSGVIVSQDRQDAAELRFVAEAPAAPSSPRTPASFALHETAGNGRLNPRAAGLSRTPGNPSGDDEC